MNITKPQNRPAGKVTLTDVAEACGVSIATVSRVLNKQAHVTEDMRARVTQAIIELGYYPNTAARSLVTHRSFAIGALVPTIEYPGFARTVQAMQRRLGQEGYTMLQASSEYDLAREFEQAKLLVQQRVDGLMLIGGRHNPELYAWLRQSKIPFVNSWIADSGGNGPCVGFDNRRASAQMAELLLDLGHKKIAMMVGNTHSNDRAAERLAGVREALALRGLRLHGERLLERPFKIGEGRHALRALMDGDDHPTAIICSNDMLAFGAISEATRLGYAIPADLSIVGFDDDDFAQELTPPLTTMRVEAAQIGVLAAETLLDMISGRQTPEALDTPLSIVVRQSAGPPPDERQHD